MRQAITSTRISPWVCGTRSLLRYQVDHCIIAQALLLCSLCIPVLASCHLTYVSIHTARDAIVDLSAKKWVTLTEILCVLAFFRSRMSAGDPSGVEFDNRVLASRPIRSLVEDANALYMSSQCAVPLRSDFVNDNFSTSGSTAHPSDDCSAHRFPVPTHAPHPAGVSPLPPVFFPTPLTKSRLWHYLKCWTTLMHLTTLSTQF